MAALDEKTLRETLDFAVDAAQLAGSFTLGYFNASPPVELKADRTPVTAADRGAEERLRQRIERAFPTHGIVGEEFGVKAGTEPARWILDPIDGTVSFICGVPIYAVLVAFEWEGEAVAGVIHLPALGETVYAARGLGCRWNGRPAHVSGVRELAEARLVHAGIKHAKKFGRGAEVERLLTACGTERGFCDAYGYALVATGRAEISLDPVMALWDTAALLPVLTEAGGTLTDFAGTPTHTAPEALATNGHVFDAVMRTVRG